MSYSNELYGGLGEDLDDPYHADNVHQETDQATVFSVSSSLYMPLSALEPAKLSAKPLSRLGTPRSLAQQCVSIHSNTVPERAYAGKSACEQIKWPHGTVVPFSAAKS